MHAVHTSYDRQDNIYTSFFFIFATDENNKREHKKEGWEYVSKKISIVKAYAKAGRVEDTETLSKK